MLAWEKSQIEQKFLIKRICHSRESGNPVLLNVSWIPCRVSLARNDEIVIVTQSARPERVT